MRTRPATLLLLTIAFGAPALLPAPSASAAQPVAPSLDSDDPLIQAAHEGDIEAVEKLIEEGADIEAQHKGNDIYRAWTPLIFAIRNRHEEIVRALLDAGAEIETKYVVERIYFSEGTVQAEVIAARYANRAIMEMIIEAGGNTEAERAETDSLLHLAAGNTDPALIHYLIEDLGFDPNIGNEGGRTPIFNACQWLQPKLPDPYIEDRIQRDEERLISRLLVMNELFELGAEINAFDSSGNTPLLIAARHGTYEQVKFLLERGAETFDDPQDEFVVEPDADRTRTLIPICVVAADTGDRGVIELLAEHGADLNATDSYGRDLLWIAVDEANNLVIPELLAIGFSPDVIDSQGRTLLMHACLSLTDTSRLRNRHRGHLPTLKLLIEGGADVNAKDIEGRTALHYAAGSGVPELVEALLEAGADPEAKDNEGRTPMLYTTGEAPRMSRSPIVLDARAKGAAPLEAAIKADEEAGDTENTDSNEGGE